MHKYLNAIGFHDIASEREWYQILLESEKKFSGYDRIALDEHTDLCELRREYGNGIGISSCGFIDAISWNPIAFKYLCKIYLVFYLISDLTPMYGRSTSGMRTEPSA